MVCNISEILNDNRYPEYPTKFYVNMGDDNLSASFSYHLSLLKKDSEIEVKGIVEGGGMRSRDCLDDEDSDTLSIGMEYNSLPYMLDNIRKLHPGFKVTGNIVGVNEPLYHNKRDYNF